MIVSAVIFFFGYPLLVHWMTSSSLRRRIAALEASLETVRSELHALRNTGVKAEPGAARETAAAPPASSAAPSAASSPASPAASPPATPRRPVPAAAPAPQALPIALPLPVPAPAVPSVAPPRTTPATRPDQAAPPPPPTPSKPPTRPVAAPAWVRAIRTWLFSGNLVAKLGLLILFIGVSFLLKYAAERVTVPIELRLAAIVVADIALLAWGWRLRTTRPGISLPIQGAALGILMLVTFGAFRLYQLIPSGMAFALLFVLTAFTCILAVLQNALWLAVFGIAGGFVAPILTSTGQGSHVALFSYYAVLNAGVLAIALKRTWRALNLLGFAFTFVIGASWGVLRYAADDYLSAQLFLLLFFAYYVAIAVVYGLRQSVALKAYVDATLVFGTPLAAFALQAGLVRKMEFGLAWSALGFGLFYTALGLALWRRRGAGLKMLVETFLALGLVFGTLALPFALDGRWTSAAWALEGAGVVWVALRQRQRLAFWFGMLVQAGAWTSFIGAVSGLSGESARNANLWLGFLILAASAFFMAITLRKQRDGDTPRFTRAPGMFLAGAALWLLAGAWTEIALRQSGTSMANLLTVSGLAVALILGAIAVRMRWRIAASFSLVVQATAGLVLLVLAIDAWDWGADAPTLFAKPLLGALMICAAALLTSWRIASSMAAGVLPAAFTKVARLMLAWAGFWWFAPIIHTLADYLALRLPAHWHDPDISFTLPILVASLASLSALGGAAAARRLRWRDARWLSAPAWFALPVTCAMLLAYLYGDARLPGALAWSGFALTWACSEYLLHAWRRNDWPLAQWALKLVHLVRGVGPWLMLWKTGQLAINGWLYNIDGLDGGGAIASASWANFVPAWAMMAVVAWLTVRARTDRWPVAPLSGWYRATLIPAATAWSLLLAGAWNLAQDGSMAPPPYVPLLNPLDLTTAFALLLAVYGYRMVRADAPLAGRHPRLLARLPVAGLVAAYLWFNLILLRTAAQLFDIDYHVDALFASLLVQAMLSLVWSVSALVLMRRAVQRASRRWWMVGAGLLALVVGKLFLVDLDGSGSVARIVSFVGVGLLMVLIGYLAPYPADSQPEPVLQKA